MSNLKEYRKKRNFTKTSEPKGSINKKIPNRLIYVIQSHFARNHHYDLRLEMNSVLKSWAIPKSPPIKTGIKRLAIQVEDHPLSYAKFQGEIKEGYGKGIVKIYDSGTYELISKDEKKIEINIHGKKLKGKYVLVKTKYGNNKNSWLFMKI